MKMKIFLEVLEGLFGTITALGASALIFGALGLFPQQNYILSDAWSVSLMIAFWVTLLVGLCAPISILILSKVERWDVIPKKDLIALAVLVSATVQTGIGWAFALSNTPSGWFLFLIIGVLMMTLAWVIGRDRDQSRPVYSD